LKVSNDSGSDAADGNISTMTNPYGAIFRVRGTKGFAAAAFIARLPVAMVPIGIVTMLSELRGEYWLAGAVAATVTLTNAAVAPQISRLVDRLGQFRLIVPTTTISVLAFVVLVIAAHRNWPAWTLFAAALPAAVMPSMSAMVRARWTELFRDRPELNTAFAFESAADELVYIAGASLSVGLSVALFPEAGILVSTLLLAAGTTVFVLQRRTEPPIRIADSGRNVSAIFLPPVQIITLILVFVGAIFATAEVSTVALTRDLGQPGTASLVIGLYAAGSFVVGVVIGALKVTRPLLVERRVPPGVLTEGVTWVTTGIGIGMALGAFLSGWVVDAFGARSGFLVSAGAATAALSIALVGQRVLARAIAPVEA
jgi:MFS family permease